MPHWCRPAPWPPTGNATTSGFPGLASRVPPHCSSDTPRCGRGRRPRGGAARECTKEVKHAKDTKLACSWPACPVELENAAFGLSPEASGLRLVRPLLHVVQAHHRAHGLLLRVDDLGGLQDDFASRVAYFVFYAIESVVHFRSQRSKFTPKSADITAKATGFTARSTEFAVQLFRVARNQPDLLGHAIDCFRDPGRREIGQACF